MMLYEWAFPMYHKLLYYTICKPKNSLCFDIEVDHDLNINISLARAREARMKSQLYMCGVDVTCGLRFEGYTYARGP